MKTHIFVFADQPTVHSGGVEKEGLQSMGLPRLVAPSFFINCIIFPKELERPRVIGLTEAGINHA